MHFQTPRHHCEIGRRTISRCEYVLTTKLYADFAYDPSSLADMRKSEEDPCIPLRYKYRAQGLDQHGL